MKYVDIIVEIYTLLGGNMRKYSSFQNLSTAWYTICEIHQCWHSTDHSVRYGNCFFSVEFYGGSISR